MWLEENDSGDMNFVCELLMKIAAENNIAVDIPHHVHKGQIAPGDADAGRGSSAIRDAGRLIFTLTPMSETEAKSFDISPDERFRYVRLDSAKVNIASRATAATWFRIIGVDIGNGTPEYPAGDTVQVAGALAAARCLGRPVHSHAQCDPRRNRCWVCGRG